MRKLLLGIDIGSSSIKVSLLDANSGKSIGAKSFPEEEMLIQSPEKGWAEQDPETWWKYVQQATKHVLSGAAVKPKELQGIGIAYQMHGLVLVDQNQEVLRA